MSEGVVEDDALAALLCDKWSRILSVSLSHTQPHTQTQTISPADLHSVRAEWVAVDRLCVYLREERASTVMGLVRFHVLHALVCRLLADAAQLETDRATAKNNNNNSYNSNTHSNTNTNNSNVFTNGDANSSSINSHTNANSNIPDSSSAKVKSTGADCDTDTAIASRINFLHRQALTLISLSLEQFHDYAPADVFAILQLTCDTDSLALSRTHNRCSRNHSRKYLIKEEGTHEGEDQEGDNDDDEEEEDETDERDHPLARLLHPRTRNDEQSAAAVSKRELVFLWLASTPLYSVLNFYFSHHCYNHQNSSNALTQSSVSPTLSLQSPRALVSSDRLTPPHSPHTQHNAPHSPSRHRLHDLSLTLASPPPLSCTQAHTHNIATEEQRVLREQFLQTKKLALDLAVVMTHSALQWDAVAMGFPLYPHSHNAPKKRHTRTPTRSHTEKPTRGRALQGYERQVLLLFLKLCESFTVSAPSHWPFMPAECFATVCVPSIERESCAVKIRALFTYSHLHHVATPAGSNPATHSHTQAQNPHNTHTQRGAESESAAVVTSTATASTASAQLSRSRSASKSSRSRANSGASSSSLGSSSTLDRIEEAARRHVWRERLTVVQIYQLTYLSLAERERMERRRERQSKREVQNEDDILCGALMDMHIVGADGKSSFTSDDVGSNLENYFTEQSISYRTITTTRTAQSYAKEEAALNEKQEDEREVNEMVTLCESLLRRLATCSQQPNANAALQRAQKKPGAASSTTFPSIAHPASLARDSFALRDKNAVVTYRNANECFLCHQHVRGLVEKYTVFSSPNREREREKEQERERELGAEAGSTSTTRRRHHCRVCGETICSTCSSSAHSSRRSSQSILSPSATTRRSSWATANPNGTPQKSSRISSMRRLSLTPTRDTDKPPSSAAAHNNKERTCLACDEVLHSMLLPIVQELKDAQAMQQGECDCAYCMNVMTESGMIPLSEALRQWRDGHSDIGDMAQGGVWKEFSEMDDEEENP